VEGFEYVEHRPVDFVQKSRRNMDLVIRRHPYEILVERSMMDRAKAQSVARAEKMP
jgi:hypothetical protein